MCQVAASFHGERPHLCYREHLMICGDTVLVTKLPEEHAEA